MPERPSVAPRTFFLNETHEHARNEREGWGPVPKYSTIDWSGKSTRLVASLRAARDKVHRGADPLRETRLFLLSCPEAMVEQDSKAKTAKDGFRQITTTFSGEHARVFERLGLDLLRITGDGDAIVHAKPATVDQLEATAARLPDAGKREQARWALLREFRLPPIETRVDVAWLKDLDAGTAHEVVVEFQPVLTRADADRLIEAIRRGLTEPEGERVVGGGRDPSGRRWVRAQMRPQQIERFALEFQSIQAIHAPLRATLFAASTDQPADHASTQSWPLNPGDLPVVAVVDARCAKRTSAFGTISTRPVPPPRRRADGSWGPRLSRGIPSGVRRSGGWTRVHATAGWLPVPRCRRACPRE